MHQKKSNKIFIYLFFFVILGTLNNLKILNLDPFRITNFQISGLDKNYKREIEDDLNNLSEFNIFFNDKIFLKSALKSNSLIETFNVFKIYPSTLKIQIKKTNFLARLNISGDIYLIGSNGKITKDYLLSDSEKLPFVFGNPNIEQFLKIFSIIGLSNFRYDDIKNLFFYKSGRVDLEMKNDILIKLPLDNLEVTLKNISQLMTNDQLSNKIIDARVSNQIILYD